MWTSPSDITWGPNEYYDGKQLKGQEVKDYYDELVKYSTILYVHFKELGVTKYRKDVLYSTVDLLGKTLVDFYIIKIAKQYMIYIRGGFPIYIETKISMLIPYSLESG